MGLLLTRYHPIHVIINDDNLLVIYPKYCTISDIVLCKIEIYSINICTGNYLLIGRDFDSKEGQCCCHSSNQIIFVNGYIGSLPDIMYRTRYHIEIDLCGCIVK